VAWKIFARGDGVLHFELLGSKDVTPAALQFPINPNITKSQQKNDRLEGILEHEFIRGPV